MPRFVDLTNLSTARTALGFTAIGDAVGTAETTLAARDAIDAQLALWVPVTSGDFSAAISQIQSAGHGVIHVPGGTTLTLTAETVLPDEVVGLVVDGEVVIDADVIGFSRTGTPLGSGADLLGSNVDAGDRNLTVTSSAAYSEDDWVFVWSSDVLSNSTSRLGYMRQVTYIPDGTTVRVDSGIPRNMTTANSVRMRRIQLAEPFFVAGSGLIRYSDPENQFEEMFSFTLMPQPYFAPTLRLRDGGGACIRLNHVIGGAGPLTPNIDNFLDDNQYAGHYGYGVALCGGCRDIVVEGTISRCRHACTTLTGPPLSAFTYYGEPENFTFAPVTFKCTDKSLDTHRQGFGGRYVVRDTGSAGVSIRADGIYVEGHIHQLNPLGSGSVITVGAASNPTDGTIDHAPTIGHLYVSGSNSLTNPFLTHYSDVNLTVWPTLANFEGGFLDSNGGDVSYPPNGNRRYEITPFTTPDVVTGTWAITQDSSSIHAGYLESSSGQNAALEWRIALDAGEWEVDILSRKGSSQGIAKVLIDGEVVGTADMYAAVGARNQVDTVSGGAGATVTWNGTHELKILMDTKNASSGDYRAWIQQITVRRVDALVAGS